MKKTLPAATEAASNLPVDNAEWHWVELSYREGLMSVLKIAIENGICSASTLRKARQEGWPTPAT
jgi:hypothetical protein